VRGYMTRGGGDKLSLGSSSSRRFRSSHLVHPPIAPRDDAGLSSSLLAMSESLALLCCVLIEILILIY
jgi:hypothetical protein